MSGNDRRNEFLEVIRNADFIALRLHAIPARPVIVVPEAIESWAETLTEEEVDKLLPVGIDAGGEGITVYVG